MYNSLGLSSCLLYTLDGWFSPPLTSGVGLIGASALHASAASGHLANAMLMGIDLGPNLSVTGSLATILWLIALRRENLQVSAWSFLKVGMIVMPVALLLAGLFLGFTSR